MRKLASRKQTQDEEPPRRDVFHSLQHAMLALDPRRISLARGGSSSS
jgi:hypothetical protein